MQSVNRFFERALVALGAALALAACEKDEPPAAAQEAQAPSASAAPRTPAPTLRFPIPTGPMLEIIPGAGLGPIRFGATIETIERHMQAPCDYVDEGVCRYVGRAAEFHLSDGVVGRIKVHRRDRPAGKNEQGEPAVYGIFNGAIRPDLQVGMIPEAIQEVLGPPARVERIENPGPNHEVERHFYPGMQLTYDRLDNGKLALGEVELLRDPAATKAWEAKHFPNQGKALQESKARKRTVR
jgi:hypothetical protein